MTSTQGTEGQIDTLPNTPVNTVVSFHLSPDQTPAPENYSLTSHMHE